MLFFDLDCDLPILHRLTATGHMIGLLSPIMDAGAMTDSIHDVRDKEVKSMKTDVDTSASFQLPS
jgi:hypothetical protein